MFRRRVVWFIADLDALAPAIGQQVDAGSEDVAGKSSSLMIVLGTHGFDETGGGCGVVPEQPVRRDAVAAVVYHQVEVGAVQRRLGHLTQHVIGTVDLEADDLEA